MEAAVIDTRAFKPHSTRAAATSKAKAACVPIHDMLRNAGWSSSRCFDPFYNKPLEPSSLHRPSSGLIRTYSRAIIVAQFSFLKL